MRGAERAAPRTDIEIELAEIWATVLASDEEIGVHDDFFEVGGDSIKAAEMAILIRERFGYKLPIAAIFENATIVGLRLLLRGPAVRDSSQALVPIRTGGRGIPTFCMHPIGGGVARYAALSKALGLGWPVYGLQAIGLNPGCVPHASIQDMATHYVAEMQRVRPGEACGLLGYSFGGLIAFEVAHQIIEEGGALAFVALIDTGIGSDYMESDNGDEDFFYKGLVKYALNLPYTPGRFRGMSREASLQSILREAADAGLLRLEGGTDLIGTILDVVTANRKALLGYKPRPLAGPVLVFTAGSVPADPALGWSDYARDVIVHHIGGNHFKMMDEPAVSRIAAVLETYLRRSFSYDVP